MGITAVTIEGRNPGNLRNNPLGSPWKGQTGVDEHGFPTFATMELGMQALCNQLLIDADVHGCRTVIDFITRWAPPSENATKLYIAYVAKVLGVEPTDKLDMHDAPTLYWMAVGIGEYENGRQAFADAVDTDTLDLAVDQALLDRPRVASTQGAKGRKLI